MIEHGSERGRVRVERPKKSRLAGERPKAGRWRKWLRRLCVEAALCLATSGLINGLILLLLSARIAHAEDRWEVLATLAFTCVCALFLSVYGICKRMQP
jgi:hypothetical protein